MTTAKREHISSIITNVTGSDFASDLLVQVAELAEHLHGDAPQRQTARRPGQKGEIVTALALNLAASALFELIKLAAARLINHPYYDPLVVLKINDESMTLEDGVRRK